MQRMQTHGYRRDKHQIKTKANTKTPMLRTVMRAKINAQYPRCIFPCSRVVAEKPNAQHRVVWNRKCEVVSFSSSPSSRWSILELYRNEGQVVVIIGEHGQVDEVLLGLLQSHLMTMCALLPA